MKHTARYAAIENLLRVVPRKGLGVVAVIIIGWFLREVYRWDWRNENYVIRANKNYYIDPSNVYKYYGSYGKS